MRGELGALASLAVAGTLWGLAAGSAGCRPRSVSSSAKSGASIRWSVDIGAAATASGLDVGLDGTVYAATYSTPETPPPGHSSAEGFWEASLCAVDPQGRVIRCLPGTVARGKVEMWIRATPRGAVVAVDREGGIYSFLGEGAHFHAVGVRVSGPPAISQSGELFVGGGEGLLLLQPGADGPATPFTLGRSFASAPAIGEDGSLYFTDGSGLHGVSAGGYPLWDAETRGRARPVRAPDGTLYLAHEQALSAFDSGGHATWDVEVQAPLATPAAPAADGSVYVATSSGLLHSLEKGRKRWSFALEQPIASHLSVDPDGTVFAADRAGKVYAIEPDGRLRWTARLPGFPGTPVPGPDGTVYVPCSDGRLHAVAPPPDEE